MRKNWLILTLMLTSPCLMIPHEETLLGDLPTYQPKCEVDAMTTMPPLIVTRPSVVRYLVSIMDSSESDDDVLISPIPQGDGVGMPTTAMERPVRLWVKIANVDIKPMRVNSMAMHIEPTLIAMVMHHSEALVIATTTMLDTPHSEISS
ncbi:uncharacterized protein A4U43_C02F14890 [Asparagus officinalis]|uniref:Uncharacterized protein n=1 Tax=Asparagus officinalis TaxID=4686 RepID=A0A5P1FN86_ASPOF|nr:uncharacterized protein A4U43_C02F14890 [Asparagus officinalis]